MKVQPNASLVYGDANTFFIHREGKLYDKVCAFIHTNNMEKARVIRAINEAMKENDYKFPLSDDEQENVEVVIAGIAHEVTIKLEIEELCFDGLNDTYNAWVQPVFHSPELKCNVILSRDFGTNFENAESMADAFIDAVNEWERVEALLGKLN